MKMNQMEVMKIGNVIVDYWQGYEGAEETVRALKETGCSKPRQFMEVIKKHEKNWPERLTIYYAEKITMENAGRYYNKEDREKEEWR